MNRYHYVQCGNCIDIFDTFTGKTVAYINCMERSAHETFADWLANDQPAPWTRKLEIALLVGALLAGFIVAGLV